MDRGGGPSSPKPPDSLQPPELTIAKLTDVGRARPHNEDYVDSYVPRDPQQMARKGALYLVADGMGGHQAGEVASQGAVESVISQYYGDTAHDVGTSLVRAVRAANQRLYEWAQADPSKSGMGTTLVAAVLLGRKVYVVNVGDSRAYLVNHTGIRQITEDHSWVEEQVRANLLTREEARQHPQRNLVTRALGTKAAVEVDLFEGTLGEGDILVLCTDGLTGLVEDREIAALVTEQPPEEAARSLVAQANERGGKDNISVIIVSAQKRPAPAPAPAAAAATARAERKPPAARRSRRTVGVLAGVLLVALLAAGGWFAFNQWSGGRGPAQPTVQAAVQVPTTAIVAETPASPTAEPAVTGQPLVEPVTEAVGSAEPTLTVDPSLGTATATLIPTLEPPTPTPSVPPVTPSPRPTATPSPSPQASYPAPTLTSPGENALLQGQSHFVWQYSGPPLGAGRAFDVRIWSKQHESGISKEQRRGAVAPTENTEAGIALEVVPAIQQYGAGDYYWTVVVVEVPACYPGCPPTVVGEWGEEREFSYSPAGPAPAKTRSAAPTDPPRQP